MTTDTDTQDLSRAVGRLEGRVNEHSTLLHQLRSDMTGGFEQMNARFDHLNDRIHQLMLAVIAIGGGVIAALVALIITLIVQG